MFGNEISKGYDNWSEMVKGNLRYITFPQLLVNSCAGSPHISSVVRKQCEFVVCVDLQNWEVNKEISDFCCVLQDSNTGQENN